MIKWFACERHIWVVIQALLENSTSSTRHIKLFNKCARVEAFKGLNLFLLQFIFVVCFVSRTSKCKQYATIYTRLSKGYPESHYDNKIFSCISKKRHIKSIDNIWMCFSCFINKKKNKKRWMRFDMVCLDYKWGEKCFESLWRLFYSEKNVWDWFYCGRFLNILNKFKNLKKISITHGEAFLSNLRIRTYFQTFQYFSINFILHLNNLKSFKSSSKS